MQGVICTLSHDLSFPKTFEELILTAHLQGSDM